nr:hypothetical protein 13 [Coxiellaceae bacterium]
MSTCNHDFALSELHRRFGNLIRFGVIAEIDAKKARVRVTMGKITTDWLPWLTGSAAHYRDWNPPAMGEQVLLLSPQGDYSQGIVLHGIYQQKFPAPASQASQRHYRMPDGSHWDYDDKSHCLRIQLAGQGCLMLAIGETKITINPREMTFSAPASIRLNAPTIALEGTVEGGL